MNLAERLKALIEKKTSATRRYKELEEMTGIPGGTWKTFYARGIRPSADLIEGIAKRFPQYSEWLLTGEITGNRQRNPDPPTLPEGPPNARGYIDLSALDDIVDEPYTPTKEIEDEPPATPEEIEALVNAFFGQIAKRRRKKNGDQKS